MKVLIIIPAYNEEKNIEKTVNDVLQNTPYDYIIVNDCSKDNTLEVCQKKRISCIIFASKLWINKWYTIRHEICISKPL